MRSNNLCSNPLGKKTSITYLVFMESPGLVQNAHLRNMDNKYPKSFPYSQLLTDNYIISLDVRGYTPLNQQIFSS